MSISRLSLLFLFDFHLFFILQINFFNLIDHSFVLIIVSTHEIVYVISISVGLIWDVFCLQVAHAEARKAGLEGKEELLLGLDYLRIEI